MKKLLLPLIFMMGTPVWAGGTVKLSTPVSGVVTEVHVQAGQRVKKGDKLLELSTVRFEARLMEAEAALARLQFEAEDAGKDLHRAEELYARGVSATTELDAAKLREARAAASVKEAKARLALAKKNLEDTVLYAPFDGVIKARLAEPGLVVSVDCSPPALITLGR